MHSPVNESEHQALRVGRLMERNPMFTIINVKGKNVSVGQRKTRACRVEL